MARTTSPKTESATVRNMTSRPVPPGFQSHNHCLAANGIPRDIYYGWLEAGKDPLMEAGAAFALNPPTDPANPASAQPRWDTLWPCTYKGITYRNYHVLCDHLERTGVIRKWQPRHLHETLSPYDIPERDVLQWLTATGRLAGPDADEWIARAVAPLRQDSEHHRNFRANRRKGVLADACVRCRVDLTSDPGRAFIRPIDPNDRPFTAACKRKDFDHTKYETWCRSCVSAEREAKRRETRSGRT